MVIVILLMLKQSAMIPNMKTHLLMENSISLQVHKCDRHENLLNLL